MRLKDYIGKRGSGHQLARAVGVSGVIISQWKTGARQVPAERCIEIERATSGIVTCEELRPDVDWAYLRAAQVVAEPHKDEAPPARALACATQSVRLTVDRRDADRRDLARRAEAVEAPNPNQLPLALSGEPHQEAA
jgi:DNA-binding transcriptional regulator YdaS (Cro superfamily)